MKANYTDAYKYVFGSNPVLPIGEELWHWAHNISTSDLIDIMMGLALAGSTRPAMNVVEYRFKEQNKRNWFNQVAGDMPDRGCEQCRDLFGCYHGSGYVVVHDDCGKLLILKEPVASRDVYIVPFPCSCDLGVWWNFKAMLNPLEKATVEMYSGPWALLPVDLHEFITRCAVMERKRWEKVA